MMASSMSCMCCISAVCTVQPAFEIGPLLVHASNRSENGRQTVLACPLKPVW